ncbi:MAG: MerR family DNA-binding transcriptional regulator [bacterium]
MDKLYTIQEVATKLGLSDKTLRRWEEAGRFTPSRTLGNQRRYSLEDIQILDAIKHGTINEQKDLLTTEQAGKLCGVSTATLGRWENAGKIHPFITSGNTYYPRTRLLEKLDELKRDVHDQEPTPSGSDLSQDTNPVLKGSDLHAPTGTVLKRNPWLQAKEDSLASKRTVPNGTQYLPNVLISLVLIVLYHFLFNQTFTPISPQGSVQGASIVAASPDPRIDDLITKFQTHLNDQILKDAKPIPVTTVNLDRTAFAIGTSTLPKNQNQISVSQGKITPDTPVTITFTSDFSPAKKYWVTPEQGSFTLHTDFPVGTDASFNYSFLAIPASPSASASTSASLRQTI